MKKIFSFLFICVLFSLILLSPKIISAAEIPIDISMLDASDEFAPSPSMVFTTASIGYVFYIDATTQDLVYSKTTNGGNTWSAVVTVDSATTGWTSVAVWYDQWTPGDTTGTKIHIAASDDASDDIFYTFLDTSGDTLKGSMVSAVLGTTTLTEIQDGPPSITKGAAGDLFITGNFTTTAGGKVSKSSDGAGTTWGDVTPASWSTVAIDQIQLLPLVTGNDIIAIKAQTADDTIRSRIYDETGNSWDGAWSASITTLTENTTYDQWFSATIKKSTGNVYLTLANQTANAANDVEFWSFTDSGRSWTQGTSLFTNDTTVMMPAPIMDETTGDIYVAYLRGSLAADMGVYFKKSTDGGSTWGAESVALEGFKDDYKSLRTNLLSTNKLGVVYYNDDLNDILFSAVTDGMEVTINESVVDGTDEYAPSPNTVFTTDLIGYTFFIDVTSQDLAYSKTTDGGKNWSNVPIVIDTTIAGWTSVAVWYDQWTPGNTTGTKIHIAASDDAADDIFYTFLDTSGDTLKGSMVAAVSGTTTLTEATDGPPSITMGAAGDLFILGNFSSTAGGKVSKSSDGAGTTWGDVTPASWSTVAIDQIQLLPLVTGNDIIAIKAQTADDTIRSRIYDETGNSWEGAWSASITTLTENTTYDQWFSATIKKSTGNVYLSLANQTANAANDIEFWSFTDSGRTWSQGTSLFTNDTTVMMPAPIMDESTGDIYVAYLRGTLGADVSVYTKKSTDGGTTWSAESAALNLGIIDDFKSLRTNLLSSTRMYLTWMNDDMNDLMGTTVPFISSGAPDVDQKHYRWRNDNGGEEDIAGTSWYSEDWLYRKKLTIDATLVSGSGDLTNYPALISFTDSDLSAEALSTGNDILFTSSNGTTKLNHEIENYVSGTGTIVAWVNIPTLGGSTDTEIYVYYGNAAASNQETITSTWNSNYTMVWHLNEDPSGSAPQAIDPTSNNNDGTSYGLVSGDSITGLIDKATSFASNSELYYLADNATISGMGNVTLSLWFRAASWDTSGYRFLAGKSNWSSQREYRIRTDAGYLNWHVSPDGSNTSEIGSIDITGLATNTWHQVVGTYDSTTDLQAIYLDGVQITSTTYTTSGLFDGSADFAIATSGDDGGASNDDFNGDLDEVRIASTALSSDWVITEYNNYTNQGTGSGKFIKTISTEETNVPAVPAATWNAAEDTAITSVPKLTNYRLRFLLSNEGAATTGAQTYQLEVAETGTCSGGTYSAVPTDTSGDWKISASTHVTDGDPTVNIASGLTDENTTFVAGEIKDTGNTTGNITLSTTNFTEIEYSVQATTNATDGGEYCFRLNNTDTYTSYAQTTIAGAGGSSAFTQSSYRFYVDSDNQDVTDPWGNPNIAEDTILALLPVSNEAPQDTDEVRVRVAITVSGSDLTASTKQFKLQYKTGSDASCTTGTWTDVGVGGGGEIWRYATSGVTDGTTLTATKLSVSDILGVYAKANPTATNPNGATVGQALEYDFHLNNNGAATGSTYSFRVVESDDTPLNYTYCPTLTTKQVTSQELRHGNVFSQNGVEQGFTRAD
ncbi:DUF2341 domain-containing protein [Candidatus Woesebacteria bacterium]|nr:DUF2341 domain-containing protein [Candidatus Woesebacteria bacterium]